MKNLFALKLTATKAHRFLSLKCYWKKHTLTAPHNMNKSKVAKRKIFPEKKSSVEKLCSLYLSRQNLDNFMFVWTPWEEGKSQNWNGISVCRIFLLECVVFLIPAVCACLVFCPFIYWPIESAVRLSAVTCVCGSEKNWTTRKPLEISSELCACVSACEVTEESKKNVGRGEVERSRWA